MAHKEQENSNSLSKETDSAANIDGTIQFPRDDKDKVEPVVGEVSADEAKTELPKITEAHEMKFDGIKNLAERFYEVMKHYKGEQWTLAKIKAQSKELPAIIQELEALLEQGGIKNPSQRKELLSAVIESAQHAKNVHEFWHSISDHKIMVPKLAPDKFYRAIVAGLQERGAEDDQGDKGYAMAA